MFLYDSYSFFERRNSYRKGIQEHVKLSAAHAIVFMESLTMHMDEVVQLI